MIHLKVVNDTFINEKVDSNHKKLIAVLISLEDIKEEMQTLFRHFELVNQSNQLFIKIISKC